MNDNSPDVCLIDEFPDEDAINDKEIEIKVDSSKIKDSSKTLPEFHSSKINDRSSLQDVLSSMSKEVSKLNRKDSMELEEAKEEDSPPQIKEKPAKITTEIPEKIQAPIDAESQILENNESALNLISGSIQQL